MLLGLFFITISQCFEHSFQSPLFGKGLEAVSSAANPVSDARFWHPQLGDEEFKQFAKSPDPAYESELPAKGKSNFISSFKKKLGSKNYEKLKGFKSGESSAPPTNFINPHPDPDELIQSFLRYSTAQDASQRPSLIVHLASKKLWESSNPTTQEFKQWSQVLTHALNIDSSPTPTTPISIMYDLKSLQLKFSDNPEFLKDMKQIEDATRGSLKSYRYASVQTLPWGKEVFFPSEGFSDRLANWDNFQTLIQNDHTFYTALTSHNVVEYMQAFQAITHQFKTYNSYQRVISLATFYHRTQLNRASQAEIIEFQRLINTNILLEHEKDLARFIAIKNRFRIQIPKY